MLRATTEATAAAVGGANTITVHPYDIHYKQTDDFSQRISRNVSHILDEESHLSAVDNPGEGSYYIEVLTDEIARKAWDFFKLIEKQGGVQKALEANIIQGEVGRSSSMKQQALATRELVLTGVNHYPDPEQSLPDDLFRSIPKDSLHQSEEEPTIDGDNIIESLSKAFAKGATLGDVIDSFLSPQKQLYPALNTYRAAESFERLRLKTQQFSAQRGRNVTVQLVPVGHKKMRKARATFSQNFLGCAGFRVENHIGFDSVADAADEIAADKADIMVLCGADHEYPELVPQFCDSFGDESVLILAGHPKEHEEAFKDAGIDYFIYTGSNILETLQAIQIQLGMD
jgi:methylmalonyl-CoA mutase